MPCGCVEQRAPEVGPLAGEAADSARKATIPLAGESDADDSRVGVVTVLGDQPDIRRPGDQISDGGLWHLQFSGDR